ncbi:MAG: phage head-tail connector protein [Gammaproteobacteria bacterium]|nr:phage head-tail connector protein [Gammaproteobacteria bacterium]
MSFKLTTKPAFEPVSLTEAKDHLRVTDDAEDAEISVVIKSAREYCETYTGRPLITQTWKYYGRCFGNEVELMPNLQSISSVKYIDNDGNQQTINPSNYKADTVSEFGVLYPAYEYAWPSVRNVRNAVEVEFVCGYGGIDDVPKIINQALKLLLTHWDEDRSASSDVPNGIDKMLFPFRPVHF